MAGKAIEVDSLCSAQDKALQAMPIALPKICLGGAKLGTESAAAAFKETLINAIEH